MSPMRLRLRLRSLLVVLLPLVASCGQGRVLAVEVHGNGWVRMEPSGGWYAPGSAVTLTAVALEGGAFLAWGGDATGTDDPVTMVMDSDKTVSAVFLPVLVANGQVRITSHPARSLPAGTGASFTLALDLPAGAQYQVSLTMDDLPGDATTAYSSDGTPLLGANATGVNRGALPVVLSGSTFVSFARGSMTTWRLEVARVSGGLTQYGYISETFAYPVSWE